MSTHPHAMRWITVTNQNAKVTRRMRAGLTLRLSRMSRKMALTLLIFAIFRILVNTMTSRRTPTPYACHGAGEQEEDRGEGDGGDHVDGEPAPQVQPGDAPPVRVKTSSPFFTDWLKV